MLEFIIAVIVGFIVGTFLVLSALTYFRIATKVCSQMLKKDKKCNGISFNSLIKFIRKKYVFKLLYKIFIICISTFLIYKFLYVHFYTYLVIIFIILISELLNPKLNLEDFDQDWSVTLQVYANMIHPNSKCVELSNLVMQALGTSDIDLALDEVFSIYNNVGRVVKSIDYTNPFNMLAQMIMEILGTNDIDEAIEKHMIFKENSEQL